MSEESVRSTRLLLVRHGQTDANAARVWQGATDTPLNETGLAQARAVALRLKDEGRRHAAIYCSGLSRARQTAQEIAQALGHEQGVRVELGLREFSLGEWENLPYEQLRDEKRFWVRMSEDPHFAPPGGESAVEFGTRAVGALQSIAARHPGQSAVVVGHGGNLAVAMAVLLEGNGDRWPAYEMDNCAVTELSFVPDPELDQFNDMAHLS